MWVSRDGQEKMPMWCPPTPPQDESDVYVDMSLGFLYESSVMSEAQLPPVYVRREHKRAREISVGSEREGRRPLKLRRTGDDAAAAFHAPRSLFDRPTPALIKMRRDLRMQKYRGGSLANSLGRTGTLSGYSHGQPITVRPPGLARPPSAVPATDTVPEWMIHEDWALLQAVQTLQELTLNLIIVSPGHMPNWDMVADMVNCVSRTHRSAKQCRARYEANIIPREEGKVQYEPSPKKMKKQKGIYKTPQTKGGRALRTSQLYIQDNGTTFTQLYIERFEMVGGVASRRTPTVKPLLVNPTLRNPKHAAVLAETGISYDVPLSPIDVAQRRAERIIKLKNQQAAASNNAEQLRLQQQQQQQQQQQTAGTASAIKSVMSPAGSQSPMSTPPPPPPVPSTQATVQSSPAASPSTTTQSQQLSAAVVSVAGGTTVLQNQAITAQMRAPRTLTVQEMVAAANRANQAGGSLVSVTQLPNMQGQRLTSASLVAAPSSAAVAKANVKAGAIMTAGKALNPQQVQLYRQQLLQQRQREQALKTMQVTGLTAGAGTRFSAPSAATGTGGQKMSMGVATAGSSNLGVAALQVTQQRSPQQYLKQGATVAGKQTAITRTMSEAEMSALLKRQHLIQQQKAAAAAQTASVVSGVSGQVAQVQLPGQASLASSPSVSPQLMPQTVQLKTAMVQGTKVAAGSAQHLRLHQLQQKKMPQQKVTGKGNVPTQVILQSQKTLPTVTMQQLQLFKQTGGQVNAGTSSPVLTHAVMTKGGQGTGQTLQRVIPVATAGQQQLKQTFQVVTAGPGQTLTGRPGNQLLTIDSSGRQQVSVTLASALGGSIKMTGTGNVTPAQQQAILSQVTAALQCQQNLANRQGVSPGQSTVRISAPSFAAVVAQQQQAQQQAQQQVQQQAQQQQQQQQQQAIATITSQSLPSTPTQQRPAATDQ